MARIDRHLAGLAERLRSLGELVEDTFSKAVAALVARDLALARRVIESGPDIALARAAAESDCLTILALHHPVAADLRFVVTIVKAVEDLTRIAEIARVIARQALEQLQAAMGDVPADMRSLGGLALDMVRRCVDAVAARDCGLARDVLWSQAALRQARRLVSRELLRDLPVAGADVERLFGVHWIAVQIEHVASIATSIAEDLIATTEGTAVDLVAESDAPIDDLNMTARASPA